MNIVILGRQPELGLAELESIYGAAAVQPFGQAALVDAEVNPMRLGGALKLASPLAELPAADWRKLEAYLAEHLPTLLAAMPEGKVKVGLSVYGLPVSVQQLFRTGLELKKLCRTKGRSVRIVPGTGPALNSAQVLHNQLTSELGLELVFVKHGSKTWLGRTTWVQDVDDYARRDYGRPKRDAFVGMLPPKLAQIMLNLAQTEAGQRILDPFCGTGVVLQEASLMGCHVYGTDLNERMVDFTRQNLAWLQDIYKTNVGTQVEVADATNATWQPPIDHVVCETYLGQPLSGLPKPERLAEIMRDCNTILNKFLANLHGQLKPGTRLCLAVPAWRVGAGFKHLALLDRLEDIGYNRLRFQHVRQTDDLVYHREGQIVARELLVLTVIKPRS